MTTRRVSNRSLKAVMAAVGATALVGGATFGLAGASSGSGATLQQAEEETPADHAGDELTEDADDESDELDDHDKPDIDDLDEFDDDKDLTPEQEAQLLAEWAAEFAALPAEEQQEIIAEETEEAAELIEFLDVEGVSYSLIADPVTGVEFPDLEQLDEATLQRLEKLDDADDEDCEDHELDDRGEDDDDESADDEPTEEVSDS